MQINIPSQPGIDPGSKPTPPRLKLPYENQLFRSPQQASREESRTNAFDLWNKEQTPANTSALISSLQPSIRKSVMKYVGTDDPVTMAQAKRLVIEALPRYDARQAQIETFIDRQIQPIMRWHSRRKSTVKLPDKMKLYASAIGNATRELEREYGRPPSSRQIADRTGLPLKRIEEVRKFDKALLSGSYEVGSDDGDDIVTIEDQAVIDDQAAANAWLQYVHDDLSSIDQAILEHTTGLNGADVLSNTALAKKLKLSPGAISQRKARIQALLDREDELSPFQ